MATNTTRLSLSKPASGDLVSAFQGTVGTSFDTLDAAAWRYLGAWSNATAYVINDVANLSGTLYLCILGHTNHTPPDATYWVPLSGTSVAAPALTLGTSNSQGAASTAVATDATIAAFDATVPVTQAFGDAAATGSAAKAARRDHVHGMPAAPSGAQFKPTAQSGNYTAVDADVVLCDASGGAFTVTLPAVTANRVVTVKKTDSSANAITISPASGNIDGVASKTVGAQYQSFTLVADGTNWWVI